MQTVQRIQTAILSAGCTIALTIFSVTLGLGLAHTKTAGAQEPSSQCRDIDFSSSRSVLDCVGTIRHRNGSLKFSRMDSTPCAAFLNRLSREIGQPSLFRDSNSELPSCDVVAEVSEMLTGKQPLWGDCTGYPSQDLETHMRECMQSFAPAYFGPRFETQIATCESYRRAYEAALKFANNRNNQRLPEGYQPPSCDAVNRVIAGATGGSGAQWPGCMNYDPARVQEHVLACVAAEPEEFLSLRDCVAVRAVYEERLRATHGGLPANYSLLSCQDAQAVLDKAAAYKEEQEATRVARAEAAEQARQEAAEKRRLRIEEARAQIRAEQQARRGSSKTCNPGPNRHPDHEYGDVLTALEDSCVPTLTAEAQLFAAGLAEGLTSQCGLPGDPNDRVAVAKFVAATIPVGIGGRQYSNPDLGGMMADQAASQAAYAAGALAFRSLESCQDEQAIAFANSLAGYLKETASQSPWVDGCEIQYATLYSRQKCQCMADAMRGFDPGIHSRTFSRDAIKAMIEGNPLAATQMAVQCGIGDY
jgi:hypothetical protein